MHLTDRAMSVTERVRMVASDAHGALSTLLHRKWPCGPKMTAAVSTSADARSAQLHQTSLSVEAGARDPAARCDGART